MTSKHRQQSINLDGKVLDAGSMDIKIEVCKPQFYDEHMTDNFGLFDKRKATISLQEGQQDWFEKNSLVHEIFHLCVWLSTTNSEGMCLEKSEDEELVVNSLTNNFMTILKQNKWLRDYLLKD